MLKIWRREIAVLFGARERTVMLACAGLFAVAALIGTLMAWLFGMLPGEAVLIPSAVRTGLLRMVFAGAVLSSAFLVIVFCLLAPQRTALAALIELLPVPRSAALAGLNLPLLGLALLLSLVFSAPGFAMVAQLLGAPDSMLLGALLFTLLIAITQVVVFSLFTVAFETGRRIGRLPPQYASTVAAILSGGTAAALTAHDLLPTPELLAGQVQSWWHSLTPSGAFVLLLAGAVGLTDLSATAVPAAVGWGGAAGLLFLLAGRLTRSEQVSPSIRLLAGVAVPRTRVASQTWIEMLVLARTPQFSIMAVLTLAATVAVVIWEPGRDNQAVFSALTGALVMAPALVCMQSVGLTMRWHWLARHLLATPNPWVLPKAAGTFAAAGAVSCPILLILLFSGLIGVDQLLGMVGGMLAAWGASLLGGVLIPYSEEQPLSAGLTGFTVMVLFLGVAGSLEWLLGNSGLGGVPAASSVALIAFLIGYALLARRMGEDDVPRI
ncbi:hypothetical protein ACFQXA_19085 [Nocardiopsis composta]